MGKEHQTKENDGSSSPAKSDSSRPSNASVSSSGTDLGLPTCRVCQCVESDKTGDAVLSFLGISPPIQSLDRADENQKPSNSKEAQKNFEDEPCGSSGNGKDGRVEFISPEGEVFVCNADMELGLSLHQDVLIELGCSCKNDLALVHYACGLKWFINHGSTVCEICGCVATNIRSADLKKILSSLKDYETLREMTASGVPNPTQVHSRSDVDPDAVAAIRRQRLSEISLWFNPHNNNRRASNNNDLTVTQLVVEQPLNYPLENIVPSENPATRWAVEENGKKWTSHPPCGCLCFSSRDILSHYCASKNQVWASTLLGNFVCVLVSCVWHMGIPYTCSSYNLKIYITLQQSYSCQVIMEIRYHGDTA